jgi:tripartite-type tricarboxylate transporter receptor subunit TctC
VNKQDVRGLMLVCATALGTAVASQAVAQPVQRPIRLIVPQPPGGSNDLAARIIAPRLVEPLGAPVIVENRAGAGGNIGTDLIAKAPPDGSTLGLASAGPFTIAPSFFPDLPYAPDRAFAPITLLAQNPILLLVHPGVAADDVKSLIALARSKPGVLNAAIMPGTVPHMLNELFKQAAGIDVLNVPYKGGVEARNDLVSGRVQMMFSVLPPGLLSVDPPKLKGLGVASARRSVLAPGVPTLREGGIADVEAGLWAGVVAPAGVPRDFVDRTHRALSAMLAQPEVKDQFTKLALDTLGDGPEEFRRFLAAETSKWARIIKASGIKPD